ncbi:MAG: hypothetical protein WBF53_13930, partial [Litorimonas sp.]
MMTLPDPATYGLTAAPFGNVVVVRQRAPHGGWRHVEWRDGAFRWTGDARRATRVVSDQWVQTRDLLDAMSERAIANAEIDTPRPGNLPAGT